MYVLLLYLYVQGAYYVCTMYTHTHMLALIPCGIKAGILRRGKVESCQAFVLEQLQLLLLNR